MVLKKKKVYLNTLLYFSRAS